MVATIVAGNTLYFTVSGALWKSDGTTAGTQPFVGTGPSVAVQFKAVLGDILYFTATDSDHGVELWRTDGTLEGTRMVHDINPGPGSSGIQSLVAFHGALYFGANDGVHGYELWKTDGTEDGTVLVTDLNPGPNGSALFSLRASGDRLYFSELSSFFCGQPAAVYTTDGTASGTHLLRQFVAQGTSSVGFGSCFGWPPGDFLSFGGLTYFIAGDGVSGLQLWRTDGTGLGTAPVNGICSGCNAFFYSDGVLNGRTPVLQVINGRLFFFANDGVHGFEPWTSDGTEAGTRLVKDVLPGPASSTFGGGATMLGSEFVFPADSSGPGWELWTSDGTENGTFLASSSGGDLSPYPIIPVGSEVFFAASAGTIRVPNRGSRRLWKMDSAGGPASVVSDSILDPTALVNFRGTLYFAASVLDELALWKTDGTPEGTSVVRALTHRQKASSSPHRVHDLPWRR